MIAPASYPINGAENIVNIKLLQVLSNAGFEIDLISKRNKSENYPSIPFESLGIKLNSLNIIEVDNKQTLSSIYQHFLSFMKFGIVFKGSHWAIKALPIAKKLVKNNHYDYVLTKNSPSVLVGFYLKKKYNLKWVATWNDPYPRIKYPEPYGKGVNASIFLFAKQLITVIRKYADVNIFPSDRLRNYMIQYLKVDKTKTAIVPHVNINSSIINNSFKAQSKKLNLIHSGNVRSPRNPIPFLIALQRFIQKEKNSQIHVSFLGVTDSCFLSKVKELQLEKYVELLPPVDYFKSIEILSDYHCAVIIEAPCEEGVFLPTKVSDFQQSGIHTFAISPDTGVLKDLYNLGYISYFADCTSIESIETELTKIYYDFKNENLLKPIKINPEYLPENVVAQYESF